jgi:hypothetical protein
MMGSYEHGNETCHTMTVEKIIDHMSDYQLIKKNCAP